MRQQTISLEPHHDRIARGQFHFAGVPFVSSDNDGNTFTLRLVDERDGFEMLRMWIDISRLRRPEREAHDQPFTMADVRDVFDHGSSENIWCIEKLPLKIDH